MSIQEIMEVQDIDVGDTLNKMKTFAPDTVDFGKHWTTMEQTILYESDDTIIWQNDSFECYKYRTKNGETVYFGFEYKDRFGWIKLGITNNFQISIFEVVIQE